MFTRGSFEISRNDRRGMAVRLRAIQCGAAAVAANISSSCCTAGDRARTKGRVTKTTYIFSTQFQTLKGKRDLPVGPASIIPSTNTMLRAPRVLVVRRRSTRESSRRCAPAREHVLLNYSRVTASCEHEGEMREDLPSS